MSHKSHWFPLSCYFTNEYMYIHTTWLRISMNSLLHVHSGKNIFPETLHVRVFQNLLCPVKNCVFLSPISHDSHFSLLYVMQWYFSNWVWCFHKLWYGRFNHELRKMQLMQPFSQNIGLKMLKIVALSHTSQWNWPVYSALIQALVLA